MPALLLIKPAMLAIRVKLVMRVKPCCYSYCSYTDTDSNCSYFVFIVIDVLMSSGSASGVARDPCFDRSKFVTIMNLNFIG